MPNVRVERGRLRFGEWFAVSFQRTLRIPDDGQTYPLPPGLGVFPLGRAADYAGRAPAAWVEEDAVLVPLYQREALWLGFEGGKAHAVVVTAGGVNVVSGETGDEEPRRDPQNYLACPPQPWLDGFNTGDGLVRQFVAVPLGVGYTVESQLTGREEVGGLRVIVFAPKPGGAADAPLSQRTRGGVTSAPAAQMDAGAEMGLGAGGRMGQNIYPDPYGLDAWDAESYGAASVRLVNTEQYRRFTGLEPPPTPADARAYTEAGLPWFRLYDEAPGDLPAPESLRGVKSIVELETGPGAAASDEDRLDLDSLRVEPARGRDE